MPMMFIATRHAMRFFRYADAMPPAALLSPLMPLLMLDCFITL